MPDLVESFQGRDLGHLLIVAELWGVELQAPDVRVATQRLAQLLLEPELVDEVVVDLPEPVQIALMDLLQHGGRVPWAAFTRKHGALREMGPGRRDRERPFVQSPSPTEALWYRAIISKAFFDTPSGMDEFAYIPDDLLILLPEPEIKELQPMGRHASPNEKANPVLSDDTILDDACTYLAAMRMGLPETAILEGRLPGVHKISIPVLHALLYSAGLLDDQGQPSPEATRQFLEASRSESLLNLVESWQKSSRFDELRLIPGLAVEGETDNDPIKARTAILEALATLPEGSWWSLSSFVSSIHQRNPDFQRIAGDYDSWFVKDLSTGEYLRGFSHWNEVEGELIRFLICGPMHWLGLIDLAYPSDDRTQPSAFRLSAWAKDLLNGSRPSGLASEDQMMFIRTDGVVVAPRLSPRVTRYQLARFCYWEGYDGENYRYRLTPQSLSLAKNQGLRVQHLTGLLRRSTKNIPPALLKSLERWEQKGSEATIQPATILRLSSPELLQTLRNSPAARLLGEPLGPTAVIVKSRNIKKILSALADLGYFGEVDDGLLDQFVKKDLPSEVKKSPE